MQDAGRGFGPRYILGGDLLIESVSKNLAGGEYQLSYKASAKTISWQGGTAWTIEADKRQILEDADKKTFVVVQALGDKLLPASDLNIAFVVSEDVDRDIQQPQAISGLRILAVGRGNAVGGAPQSLERSGSSLKWAGGAAVDVSAGGLFTLNPGRDDYLLVEVAQLGGAGSEELPVYSLKSLVYSAIWNPPTLA